MGDGADDSSSPESASWWGDFEKAYESASLEDLKSQGDVDSTETEKVYDFVGEKQRAKIERIKGENKMRKRFFAWSSKLAAWVVGANIVLFAGYLAIRFFADDVIPDAVMLSWIASTVVETLGIVYIIARHLFPGRKWQLGSREPK